MKKIIRKRVFLIALLGVGLAIWLGRDRIQYQALCWIVLHENTPGETPMRRMVETAPDRVAALTRLWNTGRVVPREFVINYIRERNRSDRMNEMWKDLRGLIVEAVFYGDIETQQSAITLLEVRKDPDVIPMALMLINDVDPAIRALGISVIFRTGEKKYVPVFVRLLDDPDHSVRFTATGDLAMLMNSDVKLDYDPADPKSGQTATDYFKKWWPQHQKEFTDASIPEPSKISVMTMGPAPSFSLTDLDGKPLSLSDFRGKPVLLVFWATWSNACKQAIPDILDFKSKHGDEVNVIGISEDSLKDFESSKDPGAGDPNELHDHVSEFVKEQKVDYRVVLDKDGKVTRSFSADDLPVTIWIDSNGVMRRRFVGNRTSDCLEKMLQATKEPLDGKRS